MKRKYRFRWGPKRSPAEAWARPTPHDRLRQMKARDTDTGLEAGNAEDQAEELGKRAPDELTGKADHNFVPAGGQWPETFHAADDLFTDDPCRNKGIG